MAGANQFGITSIWLDWSPRYFHEYEEADWQPDYIIHHLSELPELLRRLEEEYEQKKIDRKLELLIQAFSPILYEDDEIFMQNMRTKEKISEEGSSKICTLGMDTGCRSVWTVEAI